ncbi:ISSpu17 transposase, TnpA_ISSpu17 [Moritella viscosa]|uniref:ISSpu17 transposase, TnpA_ISSpu17 n=1 Tax=Moritella viscosa TaxID=80854 RepID=A0A1L0AM45_9GAMM|nr:ISSpu17 transposase, TnpA_ISSpu17 [Moritella viscosa]
MGAKPQIEEIFAERNIHFDHSTLNRWVIKYAAQLEGKEFQCSLP